MPIGRRLIRVTDTEDGALVERAAGDVQADRQAGADVRMPRRWREAARQAQGWYSGEVEWDGLAHEHRKEGLLARVLEHDGGLIDFRGRRRLRGGDESVEVVLGEH